MSVERGAGEHPWCFSLATFRARKEDAGLHDSVSRQHAATGQRLCSRICALSAHSVKAIISKPMPIAPSSCSRPTV